MKVAITEIRGLGGAEFVRVVELPDDAEIPAGGKKVDPKTPVTEDN